MDFRDYLSDLLGQGFEYSELVRSVSFRHVLPPQQYWENLRGILERAIEFRKRAIAEAGVRGLYVAAAYRPRGGATRSAHKVGRALDLDRIGGDPREYYRCAVRFWKEHGGGLGLYTATEQSQGGIRIHIDTGRTRCWQHCRGRSVFPHDGRNLVQALARVV